MSEVKPTDGPYSFVQGNVMRLYGDGGKTCIAGVHRVGRKDAAAIANGHMLKRKLNAHDALYSAVLSAIEYFELLHPAKADGMCGVCWSPFDDEGRRVTPTSDHKPDCPLGSLIAARDLTRGDGA